MEFIVGPMSESDAWNITTWHYPPPYDFYDGDVGWIGELLDPGANYYTVRDAEGRLAGFCCYGPLAQVPGGQRLGLYADLDALDLGLGMRPELTGQGHGPAFLAACLEFARRTFAPTHFRLTVATFNERAIRVYEQAGFRPGPVFRSETPAGPTEFMLMTQDPVR